MFWYRKSLMFQDQENKLGALLITHMPDTIPDFWKNFTARIQAHFIKEFREDCSNRDKYDFLAIHYHWYNRYAEKVSD
jgi:hypothetical protein